MQENEKFFSWENGKWLIREMMNLYSSKKSYFSKKRIESGAAFIIAQWGMIFFLIAKYEVLTMTDMLMWAGAEFAISGYMIAQIQKEKRENSNVSEEES